MGYKQLMADIKNNSIEKVYLLHGEETYLIEGGLKKVKSAVVDGGLEDLNFTLLEGKDFTVDKLIDACETLPFMTEKKLVFVKNVDLFSGKKKSISQEDEEVLIKYISRVPETTCLVFVAATIDSRKKIVKEIGKAGKVLAFDKLTEGDLNKWMIKRLKDFGKTIQPKVLMTLVTNCDYLGRNATQSLFDLDNEIQKIVAFIGDKSQVEAEHIEAVITSNFQNDIFKLLDSVGEKNGKDALRRLDDMVGKGEPLGKIFVTLSNQIKNLLLTKLLLEEGYSSKMIASKIGVHPYVASKCAAQSKAFETKRLKELIQLFLEKDVMMKSGKIGDRIAMEILIVEMCKKSK